MNIAAILAGGTGTRMGGDKPKQFLEINGKKLIEYTVEKFEHHPEIDGIYIVCVSDYTDTMKDIVSHAGWSKVKRILAGGSNRRESSKIAVEAALEDFGPEDIILIHDAARPNVSADIISDNIRQTSNIGAVNTVIPSQDTILVSDDGRMLTAYTDRSKMFQVQTPQSFKLKVIKEGHDRFEMPEVTDDCALVARLGQPVALVMGDKKNVKITTAEDLTFLY